MDVLQPLHRRRHAGREVAARPTSSRPPSCAGTPETAQKPHGGPPDQQLHRRHEGRRRALALRRPVPRHHHRPAERRLRHGRPKLPIVTGQDAEIASVKPIIDGVQFSTIFKDTRKLADRPSTWRPSVPERQEARGQRHQDLRQRGQGRPVLPAQPVDRLQGQLPEGPDRLAATTPDGPKLSRRSRRPCRSDRRPGGRAPGRSARTRRRRHRRPVADPEGR